MNNYIFVDGSYFIFFRYHALSTWWRNAKKEEPFPTEPHLNEEFMEKFQRLFLKALNEIPSKLGLSTFKMFIGKDCLRESIWRTKIFPEYKLGRKPCNEIGPFFDLAYQKLFSHCTILEHDSLEADDCIALSVQKLREKKENRIFVITSDKDYLQLVSDNVSIFNMKFQNLSSQNSSHANASMDLFCKILTGDPSDNIPRSLKKCGPKTAAKFFVDRDSFHKIIAEDPDVKSAFERNQTLIDFSFIPVNLKESFYSCYENVLI